MEQQTLQVSTAFASVTELRQEMRDAAFELARKRIAGRIPDAGKEPQQDDFVKHSVGRYPGWMIGVITVLCIIFLAFAFVPSAQRLYSVAYTTNGMIDAIKEHPDSIRLAAFSFVICAEIGQVLSSIAAAVIIQERKRILLVRVNLLDLASFICLAIAITGNAVALGNHALSSSNAFLETYAPPVLVTIFSFVLKEQFLHAVEARHEAKVVFEEKHREWKQNYENAMQAWKEAYEQAEDHPKWNDVLASALREALLAANRRKKAVADLTEYDWYMLIQREMQSSEWWGYIQMQVQQQEAERIAAEEQTQREQERIDRLSRQRSVPQESKRSGTKGGKLTGEVTNANTFFDDASQQWIKECPYCEERFADATEKAAGLRLSAHLKKHKNRPETIHANGTGQGVIA